MQPLLHFPLTEARPVSPDVWWRIMQIIDRSHKNLTTKESEEVVKLLGTDREQRFLLEHVDDVNIKYETTFEWVGFDQYAYLTFTHEVYVV